jgi:hypothetical protein
VNEEQKEKLKEYSEIAGSVALAGTAVMLFVLARRIVKLEKATGEFAMASVETFRAIEERLND